MDILLSGATCATSSAAPYLYRRGNSHLGLHCGPSRRRKLKVWMLLRFRYGFRAVAVGDGCLLVWGDIRLRAPEGQELVLLSDSALGDIFLKGLCVEL